MRYLKNKELIIVITIYTFASFFLLKYDDVFYINIINPIFWADILIYLILDIKNSPIRFRVNKKYLIYMSIIAFVQICIYVDLGFILGFSKNPYSIEILSVLKNIIIQIFPIFSIEMARYIIISRNKNNKLVLVFTTILLILVQIRYNTLIDLYLNKEEIFEYICSNILPLITSGILCTYLILKGGYLFTLIYRISSVLPILILPILPDLDWFITGSIGILSPIIVYVIFKYSEKKDIRERKQIAYTKLSYLLTFAFCITLICFMTGMFKYEPISILSNSMNPTYSRGDVIIFKKLNEDELMNIQKGQIIVYAVGEKNIAHRVVNVIRQNEKVQYQTKGDNNNAPDMNLVKTEQIQGVYVFHIKYLGFPSIWLYDYFNGK